MITKDQLGELDTYIHDHDIKDLACLYFNVLADISKSRIANKHIGQTPESVLIEYLYLKNIEMRNEYEQSKLGV